VAALSARASTGASLTRLLETLDPQAPLAQRHLWLIFVLDWVRGDRASPQAAASRVTLLLDAVQARPELQHKLQQWWLALTGTVDASTLLADFGFAPRTAFMSEFAARLRHKLLPGTPETNDASELFSLAVGGSFDAQWLAALDDVTLRRLAALFTASSPVPGLTLWQRELLEAINFCAGQIRATGFAAELRQRMSAPTRQTQPFHDLAAGRGGAARRFRGHTARAPVRSGRGHRLRERLDACRQAANSVYAHLEEHGISVGLVFMLRQLRARVLRVRELMDCLLSGTPLAATARLMSHLASTSEDRRSLRALFASNSSLLAAKLAERSAETGEHYITRTPAEYRSMLAKAAGGGAVTALTTAAKFGLGALGLAAFWGGFWAGVMYSASFLLIQFLHWTLATKQPAMTAPAMAAKLKDLSRSDAVEDFVDEVTHLVRSQVAAVLGNVGMVTPCVLLISYGIYLAAATT
jgi:site-specific recombinase